MVGWDLCIYVEGGRVGIPAEGAGGAGFNSGGRMLMVGGLRSPVVGAVCSFVMVTLMFNFASYADTSGSVMRRASLFRSMEDTCNMRGIACDVANTSGVPSISARSVHGILRTLHRGDGARRGYVHASRGNCRGIIVSNGCRTSAHDDIGRNFTLDIRLGFDFSGGGMCC